MLVATIIKVPGLQGAVCGMFMSSALKAQEEHYKLHAAVAAMRAQMNGEIGGSEESHPAMKTSGEDLIRTHAAGSFALNSDAVRSHAPLNLHYRNA